MAKTPTTPSAGEDVEELELSHCWWEYKMVWVLWETFWQLLTELNVYLPYDPAIPLLGVHLREMKAVLTETYRQMFTPAFSRLAKNWNTRLSLCSLEYVCAPSWHLMLSNREESITKMPSNIDKSQVMLSEEAQQKRRLPCDSIHIQL